MSVFGARCATVLAEKGHEQQPEHVKRSQECGKYAHKPINPACLICVPKNFVFAEEAGKWRDSRNGDGGDRHCPEGDGNVFTQVAHLLHVLLIVDCMDDRTSSKE